MGWVKESFSAKGTHTGMWECRQSSMEGGVLGGQGRCIWDSLHMVFWVV